MLFKNILLWTKIRLLVSQIKSNPAPFIAAYAYEVYVSVDSIFQSLYFYQDFLD